MVKEAQELAKAKGQDRDQPRHARRLLPPPRCWSKACRRAGPKPSRDKIHAALEGLKKLTWAASGPGPDDHTGLDFADLSIIGISGNSAADAFVGRWMRVSVSTFRERHGRLNWTGLHHDRRGTA